MLPSSRSRTRSTRCVVYPSVSCTSLHLQQMSLAEAHTLALKVLRQVMEERLDENNVQLAQVTPGQGFHILNETELREAIESLPAA